MSLVSLTAENLRGARGEAIFVAKIMDFCGRDLPYFDPHFLGDKFPVFDHIVNVVSGTKINAFFFAQIKTTRAGYETRKDGRKYLKVQVSKEDLVAMFRYPGPAYLFGIDESNGDTYIVAINQERRTGFSAMPTDFRVDCSTLATLRAEVEGYWANNSASFESRFSLE